MQDKKECPLLNGKPLTAKATARLTRIRELVSGAIGTHKENLVLNRKRRSS